MTPHRFRKQRGTQNTSLLTQRSELTKLQTPQWFGHAGSIAFNT